jgi:phospholipid/cholesterol/gamma-HCH transport system permease protein
MVDRGRWAPDTSAMSKHPIEKNAPILRRSASQGSDAAIALAGDWTTLSLARRYDDLKAELLEVGAKRGISWNLSELHHLDLTGAALLWRAWGGSLPEHAVIPAALSEWFTHLKALESASVEPVARRSALTRAIENLGRGTLDFTRELRDVVWLIGRLVLDVGDCVRHPQRWPLREISAGIYRAGAQALGVLALVGFLIGVVLSYLSGDQLRRFGAEIYVINLLGIGCTRELGPLLAAILVAGRSGSSITAQLGVMRLNEEIDALTTIGVSYTQRLVLPKVIALSLAQPLAGLWTTVISLAGGMAAAQLSLGVSSAQFLDSLPRAIPIANYWIGLLKGVAFGAIIALVSCHFGLRIKPNTESLGIGTTSAVVISISSVLVADALFAMLFSHIGY